MANSKKSEPPLSLTLQPSTRFRQLLIIIHLLALIASLSNSLAWPIKLAVFFAVIGHGYRQNQQIKRPLPSVQHTTEKGWQIDGMAVTILPSTVVTPWLIFLHFRRNLQRHTLLIPQDALSGDEFKQLIVRLKTTFHNQPA